MRREPNAQYNVADPNSLAIRLALYQRRRMYQRFIDEFELPESGVRILDVGVTSDQSYVSSNYLEAWYPWKEMIIAAGIDDASFLETLYPGVKFVKADGLNLPFRDGAFDLVHASAVLEHVGNFEKQARLIKECIRVARHGIFLTTPDRRFPIEFHTILPVVHWLPKPMFRYLMRKTGRAFFADENNLNLMTAGGLRSIARSLSADGMVLSVATMPLGGWPANLLLIGKCK
jgi:hypothetical protein